MKLSYNKTKPSFAIISIFFLSVLGLLGEELTFLSNGPDDLDNAIREELFDEALLLLSRSVKNESPSVVHFAVSTDSPFSTGDEILVYLVKTRTTIGKRVDDFWKNISYNDVLICPLRVKYRNDKLSVELVGEDEIKTRADLFFITKFRGGTYSPTEENGGLSLPEGKRSLAQAVISVDNEEYRKQAWDLLNLFRPHSESSVSNAHWMFSTFGDANAFSADPIEQLFSNFLDAQKDGDISKLKELMSVVGLGEMQQEIDKMGEDRYVTFLKGYRNSQTRSERAIAIVPPTSKDSGKIATVTELQSGAKWFAIYKVVSKDGIYLLDGLEADIVITESKPFLADILAILKSEREFFTIPL
ncbi:hypothetical protein QEH52_18940 [Coraliomargarita sp. SDUM461003]|uniref:DUF2314 domain-containing protein n=1 Tax=Thalassobacterium maritimum TaxID=3041265 RepID=A0ABU1AZL8_9BACT|nr:hypothetical protein [Coraliomargarita sp. SDUM461003]MDQ8209603.1 hypothetical protein [Coraliomargarita sp. SDUM461003]